MFNVKPKARAFNAGQFSGLMAGRSDLDKYGYGCLSAFNVLTKPQGPAFRRPGTRLLSAAAFDATPSRLIRFVFSEQQRYVLEFGEYTMRVLMAAGIVLDDDEPYAIDTPWAAADLRKLHYEQRNDVMWLTCDGYAHYQLSRYGHTDWRLAACDFTDGPFLEANDNDAVTLAAASVTKDATEVALVAAGGDVFTEGNVGGLFELSHIRPEFATNATWTATNTASTGWEVLGNWEFVTHGNWDGTVKIQKSYNSGTSWQDFRTYMSKIVGGVGSRNVSASGEEKEEGIKYRVIYTHVSGSLSWDFTVAEKEVAGVVKITVVTDAKNAECTILKSPHATTATERWREGAWSTRRGFPWTVGQYKGRVWFGGNNHLPTGLWSTKAGDTTSMKDGLEADDAIVYLLTDARQNPIHWLADQNHLLIGTEGTEHELSKISEQEALSGSNIESPLQSAYGSKRMQPVICEDVTLFVAKDGRKLREMSYSFEKDGFQSSDLTLLSEDITASGIVEMAYQSAPDSRVWCVLANGTLAVMGYERLQNVIGWTPVETDGLIESVAIIPGDDGEDVIFWATARTVGGQTQRFIEVMASQRFDRQADAYFVDCGLSFDGGAPKAIEGIALGGGLDPALEALWTFEEGSGTTAEDATGNGHAAALPAGTAFTEGQCFGGVTTPDWSYGTVPDSESLRFGTTSFSIQGWVKYDVSQRSMARKVIYDGHWTGWWFTTNVSGAVSLIIYNEAVTSKSAQGTTNLIDNEWHLLTGVCDRETNELRVYLDGILEGTTDITGFPTLENTADIKLAESFNANNCISGTVGLYHGVLTESQIAAFMACNVTDTGVTMTVSGHGVSAGEKIRMSGVTGCEWLNGRVFSAADVTADTFRLKLADGSATIDGSVLTAYTGGGSIQRVAVDLAGLDHLEGRTVAILADGGTLPEQTVTDGTITLPEGKEAVVVHAGLGYRSILSPMPFEVPTQTGSSPSYKQRIWELIVHLYRSLGLKIGPSLDRLEEVNFQTINAPLDQPPALFTGLKRISFSGGYTDRGEIYLVQDDPLPMCVLSIEPKMGVEAG